MSIAITGGIAEGKSTVLAALASMGASTGSADEVARTLFGDPEVQNELGSLLNVSTPVQPASLRQLISADPTVRRQINKYLHPLIMEELSRMDCDFVEIPLLIEVCSQSLFSEVWVVTCGLVEQSRRLELRYPGADVQSILETQLDTRIKVAFADAIVQTGGGINDFQELLKKEVKRVGLPLVV